MDSSAISEGFNNGNAEKGTSPVLEAEKTDVQSINAVRNGESRAWSQVAGSFFLSSNTWCASYSFFGRLAQFKLFQFQAVCSSLPNGLSLILLQPSDHDIGA